MATVNVRNWKQLERHPLSAEYDDIFGPQWDALKESIREHGFDPNSPVVLAPDEADRNKTKVGDGWQRLRACIELGVKPIFANIPRGITLEQYIAQHNDARRHESPAQAERRIARRRQAVAEAKAAGESNRTIAEKVGVSEATVRSDLEEATAHGFAVEPPEGKVTGRDGRQQPAKKAATTKGKPTWNSKRLMKVIHDVRPALDACAEALGKAKIPQGGPEAKSDRENLKDRLARVFSASSRCERCHELMSALLEEVKIWSA